VHLVDGQAQQLQDAEGFIRQLQKENRQESAGKIFTHGIDELESALRDSWLVVECVPEKIELKRKVLKQLDELAPLDTIVASNSSSYPISELIEGLELRGDQRVLSAHSCE
jgi:3-hydroxyacyl-CoA dehydrogenase